LIAIFVSYEGILGKNDIYSLGRILPSLAELIQQYGMSPEYAFLICARYFSDLRISAIPVTVFFLFYSSTL